MWWVRLVWLTLAEEIICLFAVAQTATLHANLQSIHGVSYNFELWPTPNQPSSRTPPIHGRQMLTDEMLSAPSVLTESLNLCEKTTNLTELRCKIALVRKSDKCSLEQQVRNVDSVLGFAVVILDLDLRESDDNQLNDEHYASEDTNVSKIANGKTDSELNRFTIPILYASSNDSQHLIYVHRETDSHHLKIGRNLSNSSDGFTPCPPISNVTDSTIQKNRQVLQGINNIIQDDVPNDREATTASVVSDDTTSSPVQTQPSVTKSKRRMTRKPTTKSATRTKKRTAKSTGKRKRVTKAAPRRTTTKTKRRKTTPAAVTHRTTDVPSVEVSTKEPMSTIPGTISPPVIDNSTTEATTLTTSQDAKITTESIEKSTEKAAVKTTKATSKTKRRPTTSTPKKKSTKRKTGTAKRKIGTVKRKKTVTTKKKTGTTKKKTRTTKKKTGTTKKKTGTVKKKTGTVKKRRRTTTAKPSPAKKRRRTTPRPKKRRTTTPRPIRRTTKTRLRTTTPVPQVKKAKKKVKKTTMRPSTKSTPTVDPEAESQYPFYSTEAVEDYETNETGIIVELQANLAQSRHYDKHIAMWCAWVVIVSVVGGMHLNL